MLQAQSIRLIKTRDKPRYHHEARQSKKEGGYRHGSKSRPTIIQGVKRSQRAKLSQQGHDSLPTKHKQLINDQA
jgi:hypothetical protein